MTTTIQYQSHVWETKFYSDKLSAKDKTKIIEVCAKLLIKSFQNSN